MNDPSFDAETAERMLRGEPTGPTKLAELLAAASSEPATEDIDGEEVAVAAFRGTRSLPSRQPRPLPALVSLKAALIGLLLILAGGVTAAAAAQHLPSPLRHQHTPGTRTPTTLETTVTRTPPRVPSHPAPDQHDKQGAHPARPTHPGTPHAPRHLTHPAHPTPEAVHPKKSEARQEGDKEHAK